MRAFTVNKRKLKEVLAGIDFISEGLKKELSERYTGQMVYIKSHNGQPICLNKTTGNYLSVPVQLHKYHGKRFGSQ